MVLGTSYCEFFRVDALDKRIHAAAGRERGSEELFIETGDERKILQIVLAITGIHTAINSMGLVLHTNKVTSLDVRD